VKKELDRIKNESETMKELVSFANNLSFKSSKIL